MGGVCYDGEPVARWSEKVIRIIKPRTCGDCGTPLPMGTRCVRTKYIFEGSWHEETTCLACEEVFKFLWAAGAECLHHGGLSEYIHETSEHDWLPGGDYEKCPSCPVTERMRARAAKMAEAP